MKALQVLTAIAVTLISIRPGLAEDRTIDGRGNHQTDLRGAANTPMIRHGYKPDFPGRRDDHRRHADQRPQLSATPCRRSRQASPSAAD